MISIRLADWRDRTEVQSLRRLVCPVEGGLYELLKWPIYHVHTARKDGVTIGYTSVCLSPDGMADDAGTYVTENPKVVLPILRRVQVRDLSVMGWKYLFVTVPFNLTGLHNTLFGHAPLAEFPDGSLYYGAAIEVLQSRMQAAGIPDPLPLSVKQIEFLQYKASRVVDFTAQLNSLYQLTAQKAQAVKEYIG